MTRDRSSCPTPMHRPAWHYHEQEVERLLDAHASIPVLIDEAYVDFGGECDAGNC